MDVEIRRQRRGIFSGHKWDLLIVWRIQNIWPELSEWFGRDFSRKISCNTASF
jgi:hypothetical protein